MDMALVDKVLMHIRTCRQEGIRIAIDDFGTGYSNLSRLKELPVDRVKIDRTLVRDIVDSPEARMICSAVIGVTQELGLEVVVEGVERQEQMELLRLRSEEHTSELQSLHRISYAVFCVQKKKNEIK